MRRTVALLVSMILALSINSTVIFATPEPGTKSTEISEEALANEVSKEPLVTMTEPSPKPDLSPATDSDNTKAVPM